MRRIRQQFFSKKWMSSAVLLLTVFLTAIFPAQAQAPITYDGANVLIIIDQSGSMGGHAACLNRDVTENDPEDLRFQAGQYVAAWLSTFGYYASPETPIRVAALYFGNGNPGITPTLIQMDWTQVGDSSRGEAQFAIQNADLKSLLSTEVFGERDLCNTNFQEAFNRAKEMFDSLPVEAKSNKINAIIVLTDGYPCAPERPEWINRDCVAVADQKTHLDNLHHFAQTAFPSPSYQLYVVALDNNSDVSRRYWPINSEEWYAITGEARATAVGTPTAIAPQILRFLREITEPLNSTMIEIPDITLDVQTGEAKFDVPPFLSFMRINIFRDKNTPIVIHVTDTNGKELIPGTAIEGGVGVETTDLESYVPTWLITSGSAEVIAPGEWTVKVPEPINRDNVEVRIEQSFIKSNFDNLGSTQYYEWSAIPLTPNLTLGTKADSIGFTPTKYPGYTLAVTASIQKASEAAVPIKIDMIQVGDSYEGSFTPDSAGTYNISLCGTARYSDGSLYLAPPGFPPSRCGDEVNSFNPLVSSPVSFTVLPVNKEIRLDERFASTSTWYSDVPGKVYLDVTDAAGIRIPNLGASGLTVNGILTNTTTGVDEAPFPMNFQTDPTARESFVGEFKAPAAGQYTLRVEVRSANSDVPVFTRGGWALNITPVRQVEMKVLLPSGEAQIDSDISIPVLSSNPLTLQVAAISVDTGQPVDIGRLSEPSSPISNPISASLDDNNNSPNQLELTSTDGMNFSHINDYGLGNYAFTFTGPILDTAKCGCAYASPTAQTATIQVNRILPGWIWMAAAIAVATVIAIGFIIYVIAMLRKPDTFPMMGELAFYSQDTSIGQEPTWIRTENLTTRGKNSIKLKGKNIPLPTSSQVETMEISNSGIEGWAKEGRVNISYKVKGSSIPNNVTVSPDTSASGQPETWVTLYGITDGAVIYKVIIENVPGATGSSTTDVYGQADEYTYQSRSTEVGY